MLRRRRQIRLRGTRTAIARQRPAADHPRTCMPDGCHIISLRLRYIQMFPCHRSVFSNNQKALDQICPGTVNESDTAAVVPAGDYSPDTDLLSDGGSTPELSPTLTGGRLSFASATQKISRIFRHARTRSAM